MPDMFVALNAAGGIAGFTNDPGLVGGLSLAGRVYRVRPLDPGELRSAMGFPESYAILPGGARSEEGEPLAILEPVACETGDCEACRRDCPAAIDWLED